MLESVASPKKKIITHKKETNFNLQTHLERLKNAKLSIPLDQAIEIVLKLSEFELGRFLLENQGLNGEWTAYIIIHGPKILQSPERNLLTDLEKWLLTKAPAVKATQERFQIFKEKLQNSLEDNMRIASIPCGLMDDLLALDYSKVKNVKLVGIDLDQKTLELAKANIKHYFNTPECEFYSEDAWALNRQNEFDIIVSNGLNLYVSQIKTDKADENQLLIELYKQFYEALKPNGILITSFLTPPPILSPDSTWKNFKIEDLMQQKVIFNDILQPTWQSFKTQSQKKQLLESAGFKMEEIIEDSQGMFPTIVARKV